MRKPDGVVCFSPSQNAPTSSSLLGVYVHAAGNSLVLKAPRSSPFGVMWLWCHVIAPLLDQFGAPPGTLNVVCGWPHILVSQWLDSDDVDDILFIGSSERGLTLEIDCLTKGKKPILELAGNDRVLVWADAELDLAAQAIAECFYGSSQICMVPKCVVAHPAIADDLIKKLVATVETIRPGRPEDDGVILSPVLKITRFYEMLEQALGADAQLIRGGQRMDHEARVSPEGVFINPALLRIDGLDSCEAIEAVREETFFPLLPIVVPAPAPHDELLDACLAFINSNRYGLRNSLWAGDPSVIDAFCDRVGNGGLLKVNDSHIGFVPGLPTHGGTGITGGAFGEANFPMLRCSHLQGISIDTNVTPSSGLFNVGCCIGGEHDQADSVNVALLSLTTSRGA